MIVPQKKVDMRSEADRVRNKAEVTTTSRLLGDSSLMGLYPLN